MLKATNDGQADTLASANLAKSPDSRRARLEYDLVLALRSKLK
jgi:hypothetical protein